MIIHADVYAYTQGYFLLLFNVYCYHIHMSFLSLYV